MAKTVFEEMGRIHMSVRDYFLPDLKLTEKKAHIGIWEQRQEKAFSPAANIYFLFGQKVRYI